MKTYYKNESWLQFQKLEEKTFTYIINGIVDRVLAAVCHHFQGVRLLVATRGDIHVIAHGVVVLLLFIILQHPLSFCMLVGQCVCISCWDLDLSLGDFMYL